MIDLLAPAGDSFPKYIATWGVLLIVFAIVYYDFQRRRFLESNFEVMERMKVLSVRSTHITSESSLRHKGVEVFSNAITAKLTKDNDTAYALEEMKKLVQELNASASEELQLREEAERVKALFERSQFYRAEMRRTSRYKWALISVGITMTLYGGSLWRESESRSVKLGEPVPTKDATPPAS